MVIGTGMSKNRDEMRKAPKNWQEIDFEFHNGIKLHVIENFPSSFYGFRAATHRKGIINFGL